MTVEPAERHRIVVLCASPRLDGNSRALSDALVEGARERGHAAEVVQLGELMTGMLRDCRSCRLDDGRCAIDDCYEQFVHEQVVPSHALVYATPLYWYGMAAAMKNFFDRLVCYISASYPRQAEVVDGLRGKRVALLLASEERYPSAGMAVVTQIQEVSRYLHQQFVHVVNGIGNKRGEAGSIRPSRWRPRESWGGTCSSCTTATTTSTPCDRTPCGRRRGRQPTTRT